MKLLVTDKFNGIYDTYVVPQCEGEISVYKNLTEEEKTAIYALMEKRDFTAKKGSCFTCDVMHKGKLITLVYIGMGKRESMRKKNTITAIYKAYSHFIGNVIFVKRFLEISDIVEGLYYGAYKFSQFKTEAIKEKLMTLEIFSLESNLDEAIKNTYEILAKNVGLTRDLVNLPANILTPYKLATLAKEYGAQRHMEVSVLAKTDIEALKMEAFLAVAQGSVNLPYLIVMRYFGDSDSTDVVGLVGKGITYDTGGLSLKTPAGMLHMKCDMGGAATVIGTMCCLSDLKVKKNVIAVIAACENAVGSKAFRPGDVVSTMSGKTIEVINSDAEGRLTLADAVTYAVKEENVTEIVDVATLTGAVIAAFGETTTGFVTNTATLSEKLKKAAVASGEDVWELPYMEKYRDMYRSAIADYKNLGNNGQGAGAITAAMFVQEFSDNKPWLHIDIAGTAFVTGNYNYYTEGATGEMVRTLFHYFS